MTAAWKQKKFERLAQKDVVEELKNQVRLLQDKITDLKEVNKYREMQMHEVYKQRDEYMILANRYNRLRTEEVMIATPDGFKLVTGEELDIHCGQIEAKTQAWWGQPLKPMTYTVSADDAMDSWKYVQQMEQRIQQAMVYGTSIVKMGIENGLNTGSKSEETNQEDS
jgi:hypothetical protein